MSSVPTRCRSTRRPSRSTARCGQSAPASSGWVGRDESLRTLTARRSRDPGCALAAKRPCTCWRRPTQPTAAGTTGSRAGCSGNSLPRMAINGAWRREARCSSTTARSAPMLLSAASRS
ncbi:hypothetical protein T492DRAFT_620243 [Pavlovales sp. CCMP2436]|nr:hypothetical protein T492DRAFT_620243 [Pavlovales sp. CCMP2436]